MLSRPLIRAIFSWENEPGGILDVSEQTPEGETSFTKHHRQTDKPLNTRPILATDLGRSKSLGPVDGRIIGVSLIVR